MQIKTLIIDDEQPARARVSRLVSSFPQLLVIGECANGLDALKAIDTLRPELIFLDIQMPELNGFEVLKLIDEANRPHIIFTTAFDQYALQAFEHHAMDYLLKPLDKERFNRAVEKVITQIKGESEKGFSVKLKNLLVEYEKSVTPAQKTFLIKDKGLDKVIRAEEIFWIESEGNYVNLHSYQGSYLYRSPLTALFEELKDKKFIRVHRSVLLNVPHIIKTQYLNNDTFKFVLSNSDEVVSGRSYKKDIKQFLVTASHIEQF